jgi:hypothetical protein
VLANPKKNGKGAAPRCPVCKSPRAPDAPYKPFCSKRCADVDLNRWLSGAYAIPASGGEEDEEGGSPSGGDE